MRRAICEKIFKNRLKTSAPDKFYSVPLALLAFGAAVAASTTLARSVEPTPSKPQALTVIAITDFHGALEPNIVRTASGENVESGGAALLSSYINIVRKKSPYPTIVVDGGDLFQGSLASNSAEGAPVIRFYNYLGVKAAAIGNHEFDYGPEGEKSVPMDPSDDPRGALKARIREARFPFLAANIMDDDGKTPSWVTRSAIYSRGGLRIGFVGAATPSTPSTTVRKNLGGLRFEDPAPYVEREARRLREIGKVDVVILTFHGGGACKSNALKNQDDLSTCDDGEMFKLLKALPAGLIDVAVGGHTHQGMAKRINGTAVLQSYSHGKQIGWADIPLTSEPGKPKAPARIMGFSPVCGVTVAGPFGPSCFPNDIQASNGPVSPAFFLGERIEPDHTVEALLKPDFDRVREIKERPIGIRALDSITRSYNLESALGNLTADVLRLSVRGSDVGVTNGGGLRANLSAGPLRYGDLYEVMPFDNRVATIVVDGKTLARMVELGHAGPHGSLSWSHLAFEADGCKVTSIAVDGKPLDVSATYRVVTNDYLAGGGSGFDRLGIDPSKVNVLWEGPYVLRDVMASALHDQGKDIKSDDFFDPKNPRQKIAGSCKHD